jgi:integrase
VGQRRKFGSVRKLPSGRWQAAYLGPDDLRRTAPTTFATKTDADKWLVLTQSAMLNNDWRDPAPGRQLLGSYAKTWIEERPNLRGKTLDLYRWLVSRHIEPRLSQMQLTEITPAHVRSWRANLLNDGVSDSTCAKAYRLLRAILNTAVADGVLQRNSCQIPGAGSEHPAERPVLDLEQVLKLGEIVPPRFRALIHLATFGSLRYGEATALNRIDVAEDGRLVRIRATYVERSDGTIQLGPPKSRAGRRAVGLPSFAADVVVEHLNTYVGEAQESLLFTGSTGQPLRRSGFNRAANWPEAVAAIDAPGLHFHDLRHTGNTIAAGTPGTSTRDLMDRMGHDSMRAALIYQHATRDADRRIAEAIDQQFQQTRSGQLPTVARLLYEPGKRPGPETGPINAGPEM